MRIVFIHQNMPGQYRGLMPALAQNPEHEIIGIGEAQNIKRNYIRVPDRVKLIGYQMPPVPPFSGGPGLASANEHVVRGECIARILLDLKQQGFIPDVICSHAGWGESLYIKDVFPDTRLINYCEFFYNATGQDFGFDPEFPEKPNAEWIMRTRNTTQLISLPAMDVGICPMKWQASTFPAEYRPKIAVVHEGVDTELLQPDSGAYITLASDVKLTATDEVITFVSRNLEPYRGFHIFMRALPELLRQRPKAHVIIVGGDEVSYGKTPIGATYRQMAMNEVGAQLDMSRVHFLGKVPYIDFMHIMQLSTAHVYLTYPFVLSWSMLEAMSMGCLIIGSRTTPVQEVIEDGHNGLLVDFFAPDQIVGAVNRVCDSPDRMAQLRQNARQTIIDQYDFNTICLPQQMKLIETGSL